MSVRMACERETELKTLTDPAITKVDWPKEQSNPAPQIKTVEVIEKLVQSTPKSALFFKYPSH